VRRATPAEAKRIVATGYDAIAQRYYEWSDARPSPARLGWLHRALELIPIGSEVLELGCGAGLPVTRALADGRSVTAVDMSTTQVGLARANVPQARIIQADMTTLAFPPASFDAVVAFYSLTHVPRAEQEGLLRRIHGWVRPGGLFLATMGAEDSSDEVEDDWLGVPMYFSHYGVRRNRAMVRRAGFELTEAVVNEEPEDRHGALFLWIVARRPVAESA
jgi:SAM-dependent methyltransferase